MRFHLVVNMERMNPDIDMRDVLAHITTMAQIADEGGMDVIWAAEHHAIEMTIAPNPFQLLTHYANNTNRIRLGTGIVVAPYWHPIRLAGEAAMLDVISNGRLEFGIGKGAYQREFDRMVPGMHQNEGVAVMQEMLPVVLELWKGDYAHDGHYWSFPETTSCPKPVQDPHPPLWVAARDPGTYDWALSHGCNIMSWALTRPFEEVEKYMAQFEEALARNPGVKRPKFMTMRHTAIYENESEVDYFIERLKYQGGQFENLFRALAPVVNGFPQQPDPSLIMNAGEYEKEKVLNNLVFGTPEQAIEKLRPYEELGVDYFCYNANLGVSPETQIKSLKLFVDEVMPAFQDKEAAAAAE